jgi:hypothetical protein
VGKETASKKLSICPSTYNDVMALIKGHTTQDDIVKAMYNVYIAVKHIKPTQEARIDE